MNSAKKVGSADIAAGIFKTTDGKIFLDTAVGAVVRVNIVGFITKKKSNDLFDELLLDDGEGDATIRSFEKGKLTENFEIGDLINIIGRIREYQQTKYVLADIVSKLDDKRWLVLRKKELQALRKNDNSEEEKSKNNKGQSNKTDIIKDEGPTHRIIRIIKKIDEGQGADIEAVMKMVGAGAEGIIKKLVKEGEIFEISPGMVKILE